MSHTLLLGIAMIAAAVGPVSENDAPPSTARTILGRVDAFEYMRSAQLDPRESLARGEPGTWRREFVDPRAMSSEGHDVVEWNTDLMLATTSSVLRWSAEQPFWERQFSYTRSRVLAVFEGDLIVAGWHPPANIHRWDGEQLVPLGAGIQGPFTAEATIVGALAELDGVLYAGGQFDSSAAQPLVNVARWDGAEWLPVGDNLTGRVDALTFHGGELFAAGTITVWDDGGNEVGQGVARFDGSRWQPVGQEAIGRIRVSVSDGSDLWAAGQFRVLGRSPVRAVARFDGVAWEPIGEFNNDIRDLVALPDGLWCCGHFSNMPHVARFDGSSWSSPGGGIPSAATVNKIFPWAGQLLFAGAFIDVADVATRNVSAWSPTEGWRAFGLGLDGEAFNTSMSSAGRVVAGDFVRAGGT
ncbi:MAG: hypothetical protein KDC38_17755, partial [Planctomycetes bacterium]|nr:hypothetical protein [Planctomycetota bacterium]